MKKVKRKWYKFYVVLIKYLYTNETLLRLIKKKRTQLISGIKMGHATDVKKIIENKQFYDGKFNKLD